MDKAKSYQELGKFFLDLAKLTYGGGALLALGAWVLERRIGFMRFFLAELAFGFVVTFFAWLGYRLTKKGHRTPEEEK